MDFIYQDPYPIQKDDTVYKQISSDYVKVEKLGEREILTVDPKGIELLAETAMTDVSFMLRTSHLKKLRTILEDPEATDNRYKIFSKKILAFIKQGFFLTIYFSGNYFQLLSFF